MIVKGKCTKANRENDEYVRIFRNFNQKSKKGSKFSKHMVVTVLSMHIKQLVIACILGMPNADAQLKITRQ